MRCLFIQVERLGHQKARTYKLEDYYRDFFTVLFIRGCLRYNNNNAWGEQGYADFPNKRARHFIIWDFLYLLSVANKCVVSRPKETSRVENFIRISQKSWAACLLGTLEY